MKYSNPRKVAEFNDWPSGSHKVQCKFEVEDGGKKGQRIVRTTTDKNGKWCKPKKDTYSAKVCIVDGDDGRTYILTQTEYEFIKVSRSDFMDHETVWPRENAERYNELKALLAQV